MEATLQYAQPFDLGSASNFGVNGGMGVNEYQIEMTCYRRAALRITSLMNCKR